MLKHSRIFHQRTNYLKDPVFYKAVGMPESIISVINPHDHRIRRQKISSLFSTKAADTMAPQILAIAEKAAQHMTEHGEKQKPIDLHRLLRSFTSEVLFKILFGQPSNLLDSQEEEPELLESIDSFLNHIWLIKSFPIVSWLALNMPQSLAEKAVPGLKGFKDNCAKWAKMSVDRQNSGKDIESPSSNTIFDLILAPSSSYDPSPRTIPELVDEAFLFVIAGTDTSAITVANAIYYVLSSPSVHLKLLNELEQNGIKSPESFDCKLLQRLPYLTAVMKETMRVFTVDPGVFPRVVPDGGVEVGGYFLPAGKDGSMTMISIANAQMYIILALIISRFEMELYETDASTMEWVDHGNAITLGSVRVIVKRDRWA
ncbi:hypothetical protein NHQ30_002602 [Ciborinia camelliae]|nr:hypothetical protein NHQ30_002602 [Ciborinia camelliae]